MVNMYNNLIPKPGTIRATESTTAVSSASGVCPTSLVLSAKTQFVLLDVISRPAYSLRQPSGFTSQTGSNSVDFFLNIKQRPLSFRFAITILDIMDTNIGESYLLWRSCKALAPRYQFYLFRNESHNTWSISFLSASTCFSSTETLYAYSCEEFWNMKFVRIFGLFAASLPFSMRQFNGSGSSFIPVCIYIFYMCNVPFSCKL